MQDAHHFPPDLFQLLVETIPVLCKAKKDVLMFFVGAGVPSLELEGLNATLEQTPTSISKRSITRDILGKINSHGDKYLRTRREVVKRVVEFEDFSSCWSDDQLKAKGLVSEVRRLINVKDSFTKMKIERDRERENYLSKLREADLAARDKRLRISSVRDRMNNLFISEMDPQRRGKDLETCLNELFSTYDILVLENFRRKDPELKVVVEQIDGVISFENRIYLVEMKWLKNPVGVDEISNTPTGYSFEMEFVEYSSPRAAMRLQQLATADLYLPRKL